MAKNPYWDGQVHKAVKFGDRFDSRTVEGRKRAARRAAQARRAKAEIEVLRDERPWTFREWVFRLFEKPQGQRNHFLVTAPTTGPQSWQ